MDFLPAAVVSAVMALAAWPGHIVWHWLRSKHGLGP